MIMLVQNTTAFIYDKNESVVDQISCEMGKLGDDLGIESHPNSYSIDPILPAVSSGGKLLQRVKYCHFCDSHL